MPCPRMTLWHLFHLNISRLGKLQAAAISEQAAISRMHVGAAKSQGMVPNHEPSRKSDIC